MNKILLIISGIIIWSCGSSQGNDASNIENNEEISSSGLSNSSSERIQNFSSFEEIKNVSSLYVNSSCSSTLLSNTSSVSLKHSSSSRSQISSTKLESSSSKNSPVSSVAVSSSIGNLISSSTIKLLEKLNNQNCIYREISVNTGELECKEKTYKTIKIGDNIWMAENLNVGEMNYSRNDSILEKNCYDGESSYCETDGGLYKWAEAMGLPKVCDTIECVSSLPGGFSSNMQNQGICPIGWHIPINMEWQALMSDGGGYSVVGKKMKLTSTGFSGWDDPIYNDGNSLGFSAFPAGLRDPDGNYKARGQFAYFWDAVEFDNDNSYHHFLDQNKQYLALYPALWKLHSISVRCIKNK